jgi:hypothetical protein
MNETKLQSLITIKFSQKYPKKSGQLFHVPNERNHMLQAFKARAIGIIPGVADFLFFSKSFNVATELKIEGSRHKVATLRNQIKWGRTWEAQGNTWRLCMTVKEAMSCYKGKFKGMTLDELEEKLKDVKTQTVKI